ncbi:MAG: septal ring lytic transglycosylase RlpA family protein [Elainellaceae cyanobacterium]
MNQQFLGGLTAALMAVALGQTVPAWASNIVFSDEDGDSEVPQASVLQVSDSSESTSRLNEISAVKVGEYQSQEQAAPTDDSVASIYAHQMDSHHAATLYVKDIPVLTVLGPAGSSQSSAQDNVSAVPSDQTKVGQPAARAQQAATGASTGGSTLSTESDYAQDPIWRATAIAARLNQAHRNQVAPSEITAHWDSDRELYVLKIEDELLASMDSLLVPPDTTGDDAEDILQMANRIRRLLGGEPLTNVEGRPQPVQQVALGAVQFQFSGMASWYGPGFHGRQSASGETFNQHALTAAHPSLPFGTLLQVTNAHTGRTVTVRVNDRGPYAGHRVLDLSAGAAQAIGMIQLGVAPVRVQVLGRPNTAN